MLQISKKQNCTLFNHKQKLHFIKTRITFLLTINIALAALLIFSCYQEDLTEIISVEKFEMTGGNGQCYEVTLERFKDNSVNFMSIPIPCSEDYSTRSGVYISHSVNIEKDMSGKKITLLKGSETNWYIPLLGGDPVESPGNIECFCETQEVSPGGGSLQWPRNMYMAIRWPMDALRRCRMLFRL
ncbi:MAG: hypothetical protein IT261_09635 [Saprospiraceae bacterium]|nr:hypothetical protein [Saprospiraceae bacterium]